MSISPPSDLILDVVRAADPLRKQEAMTRLGATGIAAGDCAAFDALVNAASHESTAPPMQAAATSPRTPMRSATEDLGKPEAAFRQFEAMMLANMIEAAMPEEDAATFGSGAAGATWKSILAEQLGMQMAKAGGIGIAEELAVRISGRASDT